MPKAPCLARAALFLAACAPGSRPAPGDGAPEAEAFPRRVAVLGPSTVENLLALGLGERIAAVDDYTRHPATAALRRVGGQFNPRVEAIAALRPDLVLLQGAHPELEHVCRGLGLPFRAFQTDAWASWEEEIRCLGALFGVPERASALIREKRGELRRIPRLPAPLRCLVVVARRPDAAGGLVVAGGGSFLTELLAAAGASNAFAGNPRNYFDLAEEALIRAAPEAILELRPGETGAEAAARAVWERDFPALPAVRAGRVHVLAEDFALLPGPRMPETARLLADKLAR